MTPPSADPRWSPGALVARCLCKTANRVRDKLGSAGFAYSDGAEKSAVGLKKAQNTQVYPEHLDSLGVCWGGVGTRAQTCLLSSLNITGNHGCFFSALPHWVDVEVE